MEKFTPRDRDPLFFLHIPKTAGSSMRLYLRNQYRKEIICPITMNSWDDIVSADVRGLKNFQLMHGHCGFNVRGLLHPEIKTLTVLRHPFDLTLSLIRHLKRDPGFHPLHNLAKDCSIREIIGGERFDFPFANIQTAFLSASVDPFEVYRSIKENGSVGESWNPAGLERGPDIDVAMRNLEKIDFVGLVDRLDDFLPMVSSDMSYHPPTVFPRSNAAPGDRTDFNSLASGDIEAIEACNQLDLKLYAHAQRIFEERRNRAATREQIARLRDTEVYPTFSETFELDLSAPMPGNGWYDPEKGPARSFRWTGPEREFTIAVPLEPIFQFRLRVLAASPFVTLSEENFILSMNGERLRPALVVNGEGFECLVELPKDLIARNRGVCSLKFNLPGTKRPTELGRGDERSLGIAVRSVQFEKL
jgi:hypothetical protein